MWKKLTLAALSLLLGLAANLNLCCTARINGKELEGLYAPRALDRSEMTALEAAEEILSGPAHAPEVERRYRLSFRPAEGDSRKVTDAALRSVTGVKLVQGVFINGVYLGCVESGTQLFEELRSFIGNQMPNAAVFGNISGEVQVRPIYSRSNRETNYDDMILLITGMAPVIYVDENGKLV